MGIVLAPSGAPSSTTLTVQNIISATSQDIRSLLSSTGNDAVILIDYCNRVSLDLLRASHWTFLNSAPQRFITRYGQTDYWLGATGLHPAGSVDTTLNLSNINSINDARVFDRSNFVPLTRTSEKPLLVSYSQADGDMKLYQPLLWRNAVDTPYLLNLYPAPDNANAYQPSPLPPLCETTTSGALAARTYYVRVSFVDSKGNESNASAATKTYVPVNKLLKVKAPQPAFASTATGVTYNQYKVYASTVSGSEQLQTASAQPTTGDWTEPGTGLISGAAYPTVNSLETLGGYVIEFRYAENRVQLTTAQQTLQIPDDYKDIIIAGVNFYAAQYLKLPSEAQLWGSFYQEGIKAILSDNAPSGQADYLRPDALYAGK